MCASQFAQFIVSRLHKHTLGERLGIQQGGGYDSKFLNPYPETLQVKQSAKDDSFTLSAKSHLADHL